MIRASDAPLDLARSHDATLFATASVEVGTTLVPRASPLWRRTDRTTERRTLVFPHCPLGVQLSGNEPVVVHSGLMIVPRPGRSFRRRALSAGGEHSDWIWLADDLADSLGLHDNPSWFRSVPARALIAQRRIGRLVRDASENTAEIEAELLALAAALARTPPQRAPGTNARQRRAVHDAILFLAEHYAEGPDLATIAAAAGLARAHLCTVFRRVTGRTVGQYLATYRLCTGLDRLLERNSDLTGLALELGFASHSHFSARFRSFFRCTPSEARRYLRSGRPTGIVTPR